MTFLVDANVLTEATKPDPSPHALDWLRDNESEIVIDSIILGELRFGILQLPMGKRRRKLERWFDQQVTALHCVSWDAATALRWAELIADLRRAGIEMSVEDSMTAATALVYRLTVATRNLRDFRKAGVKVVDPFA
jgi:predicted nucleic acid-binding protein